MVFRVRIRKILIYPNLLGYILCVYRTISVFSPYVFRTITIFFLYHYHIFSVKHGATKIFIPYFFRKFIAAVQFPTNPVYILHISVRLPTGRLPRENMVINRIKRVNGEY